MSDAKSDITILTVEEIILRLRGSSIEEASVYCQELISRFEPLLRRAWRKGGGIGEYQDFAQDVFVKLFRGLPSLRNAKAFPGYFKSVAFSVAATRSKRHSHSADTTYELPRDARSEDAFMTGIIVRSYLEHLSVREREVVMMSVLLGLTSEEISKHLGMEPGAVRTTKSRAFKRLRELLLRDAKILSSGD